MLATLLPLDARDFQPWKLDDAQAIRTDLRHHSFQSYHRWANDHDRIAFDQRLNTDPLGVDDEAQTTSPASAPSDPPTHSSTAPRSRHSHGPLAGHEH